MSTALFATTRLVALTDAFIRWLLPAPRAWHDPIPSTGRPKIAGQSQASSERAAMQQRPGERVRGARSELSMGNCRTLRVVRVLELGEAPAHCGRMVISGSMADVCAEIDRLAAREAFHA